MKRKTGHIIPFLLMVFLQGMFVSCDGDGRSDLESQVQAAIVADAIALETISNRIMHMSVDELAAESDLPIIIVNTENNAPILNKTDYVTATFRMTNADTDNTIELPIGIRLRGNHTSKLPKKPYRIKFDSKISLFGREQNKSWVLLADYCDLSHIKNYTAYTLAGKLGGMDFAPLARHVNLYLNGKLNGLYLLSDQVDENEGRTDVKVKSLPAVDVPFLVEIDIYAPSEGIEGVDYFKIGDKNFAIKYPEAADRDNEAQFTYVETYVKNADTAIRSHSGYEDLIDIDSFIDFYLVQELMGQLEINGNSIYMSKAVDGKLKMGPVWDFDGSAGGWNHLFEDDDYIGNYTIWFSFDNWFFALLDDPEFVNNLYSRWMALSVTIDAHIAEIEAYKDTISNDAERDHKLWKRYPGTKNPLLTFDGHYQYVLTYLANRKEWMTSTISDLYDYYY